MLRATLWQNARLGLLGAAAWWYQQRPAPPLVGAARPKPRGAFAREWLVLGPFPGDPATPEAEEQWTQHVASMYSKMLMRNAKGWFTGYNSNIDGHEHGKTRYFVYEALKPGVRFYR